MNFCEGYYEPNTTVTREQHPSENVTFCSNRTAFFHFDPTAIIQSELAPGVNLTDIHWPSEIEDAIRAIEITSKVMFIFYCIGIGLVGLALIGAAWGVLANGRISAFVNFTLDIVSLLISKRGKDNPTYLSLQLFGGGPETRIQCFVSYFLNFTLC